MTQIPADVTIPALMTGVALGGTELFEAVQTASGIGNSVKLTANQIAAFVGTSVIPLLPPQTANTFLAGPTSGAASTPAFRALVLGDLPLPSSAAQILIGQNATTIAWESISQDLALSALGTATVTGLQGRPLLATVPTTSQVLTWNGSAWLPTTLAASGITSLLTGTGLTGGPITGTGTVSLTVPVLVSLGGTGTTTTVPSGVILGGANATAALTGTTVLDVPRGGIGTGSLTPRGVILGGANATAPIGIAPAVNTGGNILIDQGTTANPIFQPMSGDVTVGLLGTTTIGANKVTYSKFQTGTGLSVLGVAGTAAANFSAISGTTDQVLIIAQNGTTLGFGAVNLATAAAVTGVLVTTALVGAYTGITRLGTLTTLAISSTANALVGISITNTNSASLADTGMILTNDAGNSFEFILNSSTNTVAAGVNSFNIYGIGNFPIGFVTNNVLRMTISGPGGISVGTTTDPGVSNFLSVGNSQIACGSALPTGGNTTIAYKISSATNFGIFCGTGVPTIAAGTGSIYLRSDGTGTTTRCYINQNGSTTWTNIVTSA